MEMDTNFGRGIDLILKIDGPFFSKCKIQLHLILF